LSTKKRGQHERSQRPGSKRPGSQRSHGKRPQHQKGADDTPHCVVGRRFVIEAIRGGTVERIFVHDALREKIPKLIELAEQAENIALVFESMAQLDARADGIKHQGVVAFGPPFRFATLDDLRAHDAPMLIALDEVQDPHNLGAIIRSALAFGAEGAILPIHRSATVTPSVVRASAGASERLPIARVTNLQRSLQDLDQAGMDVVGLSADGDVRIDELGPAPEGRVLVVGSEGTGLRRLVAERCTRMARIPQMSGFDSLNASVAAALALYEASQTR
jgi:23S rRNA (guanosine2251-2'-O)-methyltransferase